MLDIHGQPGPAVQPAVAAATAYSPTTSVEAIGGPSSHITQGLALGVVVLVLAAGGYLSYDRATKGALVATRTREVTELKEALATPERVTLATTADALKAGVTALQTAQGGTQSSAFLTALTQHTPSGTVLETVSLDDDKLVRVSGSATSYLDVARYVHALTESDQFTAVELESSALGEGSAGVSVTFAIKATFVPHDEATVEQQHSGQPFDKLRAFAPPTEGNGADES